MTNFQAATPSRIRREQVLVAVPALLGGALALGLAWLGLWPSWQKLQLEQQHLDQLEEQRQRLPLLRAQLLKLQDNLQQAEQRHQQILALIAGSGQISTFMAQLSEEAQRTGVQLDGYEPISTAAPDPDAKDKPKDKDAPPPPPPDPLLAPGLRKTSLLLTARGTGPQLLAFLRGLELLSLLVVRSDLSLKTETAKGTTPAAAAALPTLRLNLTLYAQDPAKAAAAESKSAGG